MRPLSGLLGVVISAALIATAAPAHAVDPDTGPDHEVPFLCGEVWTGSTRSGHSPSYWSIDWNRANDFRHPILASAPGVVTRVVNDSSSGYGRYTIVDHGEGHSSLYAHMETTFLTVGQRVDQSDPVGLLGSTGNSSGPHLHFEERLNGRPFAPYFTRNAFRMNSSIASKNCPDKPIAGDWNGDGSFDIGLMSRASTGVTFKQRIGTATSNVRGFGTGWDLTFTGDWNGDGKTDLGVRPPGSTTMVLRQPSGALTKIKYGTSKAVPFTGDWNGDGRTDLGAYRVDLRRFALRAPNGSSSYLTFGSTGDLPLSGDWNGDGRDEIGVYRPSIKSFVLRNANGTTETVPMGRAGVLPVTGDWNNDKVTDLGVWQPATGRFTLRTDPVGPATPTTRSFIYGAARG